MLGSQDTLPPGTLDQVWGRVFWVELQVKENRSFGGSINIMGRASVNPGPFDGFIKKRLELVSWVASGLQSVVEGPGPLILILCVCTKGMDSKQCSKDNSREQSWCMGTVRGDVEMQVQWLLIQGGAVHSLVQIDGEIQEVSTLGTLTDIPCEASVAVHCSLELLPFQSVLGWVLMMEPDSKDIVQVSLVVEKSGLEEGEEDFFLSGIVYGGNLHQQDSHLALHSSTAEMLVASGAWPPPE